MNIYCLLGDDATASTPNFCEVKAHHDLMLAAYRTKIWSAAESQIIRCRTLSYGARAELSDLYETRIAEFRDIPPPDWTGVFVATTK